ncbi:MAG: hypothetical protein K6B44_07255 [Lachnospiraceae bacterium]|nr:hypothetical protein [Lachnospiraceae bacterium]
MNAQEYKICSEEIKTLIENEQFREAVEIADTIDWRRAKSVSKLMSISDLYKINRRYEEALELMLLAYDRSPKRRSIVYSLSELYIELGDKVKAMEFLTIFRKMAPNDTGVYILQYKILELIDAPYDDRIALLEDLCRKDYREEWAYQLAYLYHRIGLGTKCVETCNELITWFGDGPFVIKAMELKMLHARLTPEQQAIYNARDDYKEEIEAYESDEYTTESAEPGVNPELGDIDFHVKTIDMSKFNTINLQKALAESMREFMEEEENDKNERITRHIMKPMLDEEEEEPEEEYTEDGGYYDEDGNYVEGDGGYYDEDGNYVEGDGGYYDEDGNYVEGEGYYDEDGNYVEGDGGYYDEDGNYVEGEEAYYEENAEYTEDSAEEGYAGEEAVEEDAENGDEGYDSDFESEELAEEPDDLPYPEVDDTEYVDNTTFIDHKTISKAALFKSENKEDVKEEKEEEEAPRLESMDDIRPETGESADNGDELFFEDKTADIVIDDPPSNTNPEYEGMHELAAEVVREEKEEKQKKEEEEAKAKEKRTKVKAPASFDDMLRFDDNGQIELALAPGIEPDIQITGQIHMDEYLSSWEEKKKLRNEEIRKETERKIKESTGPIFRGYDDKKKNSLIQDIEEEQRMFSEMYEANDIELRSVEEVAAGDMPLAKPVVEKLKTRTGVIFNQKQGSIWDEVDASIKADKEREEALAEEEYDEAEKNDTPSVFVDVASEAAEGLVNTATLPDLGEVEKAESAVFDDEGYDEEAAGEDEDYDEDYDGEYEGEENYDSEDYPEEDYEGDYEDSGEYDEEAGYEDEEYGDYDGEYDDQQEYSEDYYGEEYNTGDLSDIEGALEADADRRSLETADEMDDDYHAEEYENDLSVDEQRLFENFLYSRKMRDQILDTIDQISLTSYVGNIIVTGESTGMNVDLAKALVKEMQMIDSNFVSSRVAKISGTKLNNKDIPSLLNQLAYGALLIEKAGELKKATLEKLTSVLESYPDGILVILMDNRKNMDRLIETYEMITGYFNTRVDIIPMNNNALVEYAKKYAYSREYKIDEERGVLALHQRISELQIGEHNVTTAEIEDIVEAAIEHSSKPRISTFFNIIGGKRYDYEDMIILREKDFE